MNPGNDQYYSYTENGYLLNGSGPWGSIYYGTDGVGNLTQRSLTSGGTTTDEYFGVSSTSNRLVNVSDNTSLTRTFGHDAAGNIIAEYDGAGSVIREYIWLDERPVAVVDHSGVGPALYQVHTDHLERPVMMTDAQQAVVWEAVYLPFGGVHSITGSASLDQRFPVCSSLWLRAFVARKAKSLAFHLLRKPLLTVPARNGSPLQLASALRSDHRPLHPGRPARHARWAKPIRLCRQFSADVY